MTEVTSFYILSHIFISLVGAVLLLALWIQIRKQFKQLLEENESEKRVDKGLLYLSLAMFIWVGSGIWAYFGNRFTSQSTIGYQLGIQLLSLVNNLFLLLALFYFYYAPTFIYNNKKNINIIVVAIGITSVITVLLSMNASTSVANNPILIQGIPDLLVTGFLCYLLAISFYRTFLHRGLQVVGYVSVVIIILVFISQLSGVFLTFGNEFSNNLLKIIAKTSLIAVFLVLATSWVIRLANMPTQNEMVIQFLDWGLVKLSIPTKGIFDQTIDFKSKTTQYKNLLHFAVRRKFSDTGKQSIQVGLGGEIKNQTYLSRIIDNINSILSLENEKQLERTDIFTFVGDGNYRLRILPENIIIDEALLTEFKETTEKQRE